MQRKKTHIKWKEKLIMEDKNKMEMVSLALDQKLIEVRYGHQETQHTDYDNCYDNSYSYTEYDTIGFFDNIEGAWNLVQQRVAKYHTQIKDYSFNIVVINPSHDSCPKTNSEGYVLDNYVRDQEWQKKLEDAKKIEGYKCSECSKVLKIPNPSLIDSHQSSHSRLNHIVGGSWNHVTFETIMKKVK